MARFGIEEEFVLLDEQTLVPLRMDASTRQTVAGEHAGGVISSEYLTSQIETATAPLHAIEDGRNQLRALRSALTTRTAHHGAIVAATGAPPLATPHVEVAPSEHYDRVADILGEVTHAHEVNGLHVHVEVGSDEERVRALNRCRAWMPMLLALTGNSPFAHGRPTGFASWRTIVVKRLPVAWTPPHFADYTDYRAHVDALLALGGVTEASSIGWTARLAERYPTVEVRVVDAQLAVDDSLLAAALCRALVVTDELAASGAGGTIAAPPPDALIDASLWTAARYGLHARIVDPTTGEDAPAVDVLERMRERIAPALAEVGDEAFVTDMLARVRSDGTGAERQLRAYRAGGIPALADLYRTTTALA